MLGMEHEPHRRRLPFGECEQVLHNGTKLRPDAGVRFPQHVEFGHHTRQQGVV